MHAPCIHASHILTHRMHDKVADMEMDKVADKVADMEVDKVADVVANTANDKKEKNWPNMELDMVDSRHGS